MNTFEWDENTPVTANNLNEMQNILNENITDSIENQYNFQYNQIPVKTGRQINGNSEYIYGMEINSLPNNSSVYYATSIPLSDIAIITDIGGTGYRASDISWFKFNASRISLSNNISVNGGISGDNFAFFVETGMDRSNVKGYLYIKYTLNS